MPKPPPPTPKPDRGNLIPAYQPPAYVPQSKPEDCPHCQGIGRKGWRTCGECNGSGKKWKQK